MSLGGPDVRVCDSCGNDAAVHGCIVHDVAAFCRAPRRQAQTFPIPPSSPRVECRSCGAPIVWIATTAGRRMPVDLDGTSHFATCPDANRWRKGKRRARPLYSTAERIAEATREQAAIMRGWADKLAEAYATGAWGLVANVQAALVNTAKGLDAEADAEGRLPTMDKA